MRVGEAVASHYLLFLIVLHVHSELTKGSVLCLCVYVSCVYSCTMYM